MKKTLLVLCVILVAAIVFSVTASNGTVQKSLLYEDIKITLDGREIKPADVNGNYIEPFIIEGTTYLPVRGVASSLGLDVDWNGNTNTVILDDIIPDIKSVIYDKDGIKIAYKGMGENALDLLIQNDFTDSITLISADFEYVVPSGKKANILLPVNIKDGKTEFSFYILNTETQLGLCPETEVTANAEKAEVKIEEKPPVFEPEGEVTWETFGEFFKIHKDFDGSGSGLCIRTDFVGEGSCQVGSLKMSYSPAMPSLSLEVIAICNIFDPVANMEIVSPISMRISMLKSRDKYDLELKALMNDRITLDLNGEIDPTDGSLKIKRRAFNDAFYDDMHQKYTSVSVQDALDMMVDDVVHQLMDLAMEKGNAVLNERANGLSLEFFGLKSSKGE